MDLANNLLRSGERVLYRIEAREGSVRVKDMTFQIANRIGNRDPTRERTVLFRDNLEVVPTSVGRMAD